MKGTQKKLDLRQSPSFLAHVWRLSKCGTQRISQLNWGPQVRSSLWIHLREAFSVKVRLDRSSARSGWGGHKWSAWRRIERSRKCTGKWTGKGTRRTSCAWAHERSEDMSKSNSSGGFSEVVQGCCDPHNSTGMAWSYAKLANLNP